MLKYQTLKPGDIIISTPYSSKGVVFNKSVILIMSHDKTGTSGVIINKLLNKLDGSDILKSLQLSKAKSNSAKLKTSKSASLNVYFGGPLEQEKGIILHSKDYDIAPSMKITQNILISTNSHIINDIISGDGPIDKMLVLGYASWAEGQLIEEIKRNDWLLLIDNKPSNIFKLLFTEDPLYRWDYALSLTGINFNNYSHNIGNA